MFPGLDHVACLKIGAAYIFGLEKLEISTLLGPQTLFYYTTSLYILTDATSYMYMPTDCIKLCIK